MSQVRHLVTMLRSTTAGATIGRFRLGGEFNFIVEGHALTRRGPFVTSYRGLPSARSHATLSAFEFVAGDRPEPPAFARRKFRPT